MMISRLAGLCIAISCLYSHASAAAVQDESLPPAPTRPDSLREVVQQEGENISTDALVTDGMQADRTEDTAVDPSLLSEGYTATARSVLDAGGLTAEQWERGRSGDSILRLAAVHSAVDDWLSDTGRLIEIRYPGGEEGEFWVHELADWLVALGIPADRLLMTPGSGAGDVINFHLIRAY